MCRVSGCPGAGSSTFLSTPPPSRSQSATVNCTYVPSLKPSRVSSCQSRTARSIERPRWQRKQAGGASLEHLSQNGLSQNGYCMFSAICSQSIHLISKLPRVISIQTNKYSWMRMLVLFSSSSFLVARPSSTGLGGDWSAQLG